MIKRGSSDIVFVKKVGLGSLKGGLKQTILTNMVFNFYLEKGGGFLECSESLKNGASEGRERESMFCILIMSASPCTESKSATLYNRWYFIIVIINSYELL